MRKRYISTPDLLFLVPRFSDTPRPMQPRRVSGARLGFGALLAKLAGGRSAAKGYRERHEPTSGR